MKNVIILVHQCAISYYPDMVRASLETWDAVDVPGVKTLHYAGLPKLGIPQLVQFDVQENYTTMTDKNLRAFSLALMDSSWHYMARVNASCYVRKKVLLDYVQKCPDDGLCRGLVTKTMHGEDYIYGGGQFILSRDVIESIVKSKGVVQPTCSEDVDLSRFVTKLGFKLCGLGRMASINKKEGNEWLCLIYCDGSGGGFEFTDFHDMHKADNHHFIRVKQHFHKGLDAGLMRKLKEVGL